MYAIDNVKVMHGISQNRAKVKLVSLPSMVMDCTESANYFMPCCYCISPLDGDKAIEKHQQGAGLVIKSHIYTVYLRLM